MIFSIKDTKASKFLNLMQSENAETFKDDVLLLWTKGVKNMITEFPSRYLLYQIGTFDEDTGVLVGHNPIFVCSALDIKAAYIKSIQENQPSPDIPSFLNENNFTPSPSGNEEPAEHIVVT